MIAPVVRPADPREPGAARLLGESHALMRRLFPAESNHFLALDALAAPSIRFFVAEAEGETLGTAALAEKPGYGEVKSMFVAEAARGKGVARRLLGALEAAAAARALPLLRLETGSLLHEAHRLYRAAGFGDRGPFGDYAADPHSLFMEKPCALPPIRRAGAAEDWPAIRALVADAFAFMEGRIDPPSSLRRWTAETFAAEAADGAAYLAEAEGRPVGFVTTRPEAGRLYIGKLAVAADRRGRGLGRALVEAAADEAARRGLDGLSLGARIELVENHAAFAAMGFVRAGETAHPGFDRPTSLAMARPSPRAPAPVQ